MEYYNYIIAGGGASGLLLAYRMAADPFFDDKKILIIDKEQKTTNDRTWCFWESPGGVFDDLLFKTWKKASFKSHLVSKTFSLHPFRYKMIRSKEFYDFIHEKIIRKPNITIIIDEILALEAIKDEVQVKTVKQIYHSYKAFTSIFNDDLLYKQHQYPVLQQHFMGWFVKTDTAVFDDTAVTFMDFTVPQQGNTRFMYVLPFSKTEALIEYTLFSEKLLPRESYENAIKAYLEAMKITTYTIVEKEKGSIPMTCYDFTRHNSKNILHIGTAGGWTKPSTGYTFLNSMRKTEEVVSFLKKDIPFTKFGKKTRFWYYDMLLLDVLYRRNDLGAGIFSAIFKRNAPQRIFKFLDERSTPLEDIKIIFSLPPCQFIKSLFKRIF